MVGKTATAPRIFYVSLSQGRAVTSDHSVYDIIDDKASFVVLGDGHFISAKHHFLKVNASGNEMRTY